MSTPSALELKLSQSGRLFWIATGVLVLSKAIDFSSENYYFPNSHSIPGFLPAVIAFKLAGLIYIFSLYEAWNSERSEPWERNAITGIWAFAFALVAVWQLASSLEPENTFIVLLIVLMLLYLTFKIVQCFSDLLLGLCWFSTPRWSRAALPFAILLSSATGIVAFALVWQDEANKVYQIVWISEWESDIETGIREIDATVAGGFSPNIVGHRRGNTALMHIAMERGRVGTNDALAIYASKRLIEAGADPNISNNSGSTPLQWAAFLNRVELFRLLVDAGADVNTRVGSSPLETDWQVKDAYWGFKYVIHDAARSDRTGELIQILIENGANPNARDSESRVPLHNVRSQAVAIELIAAGAEINVADSLGTTPLHRAAYEGNLDVVKVLIESQANPNVFDDQGRLPYHSACNSLLGIDANHIATTRFLREHTDKEAIESGGSCWRIDSYDQSY